MHNTLFYNKFIIRLYMFRAPCAHHQEVKIILYSIWYYHTCRWPSGAQVERDWYHHTCRWPSGAQVERRPSVNLCTCFCSVLYCGVFLDGRCFPAILYCEVFLNSRCFHSILHYGVLNVTLHCRVWLFVATNSVCTGSKCGATFGVS